MSDDQREVILTALSRLRLLASYPRTAKRVCKESLTILTSLLAKYCDEVISFSSSSSSSGYGFSGRSEPIRVVAPYQDVAVACLGVLGALSLVPQAELTSNADSSCVLMAHLARCARLSLLPSLPTAPFGGITTSQVS